MKRCPYCAEEIQDAAVKCRYCLSDLPTAGKGAVPATPLPETSRSPIPQKAAPSPRRDPRLFDTYRTAPRSSGVSLPQAVMVACVLAAAGWMLFRMFQSSESQRARASDAGLSLYRSCADSEAPSGQRMMSLRTDSQGNPVYKEVAEPTAAKAAPDAQRQAQQFYLAGVIYYSKGDYAKAREEWQQCLALDPGNTDAEAGLKRLKDVRGETP